MAVYSKTYYGSPGGTFITDAELAFVKIIEVARNELTYYPVEGTPGSLQFKYDSSAGRIHFDPLNPFVGPEPPGRPNRFNLERIHVKYKA
jgi:hypothetical protein